MRYACGARCAVWCALVVALLYVVDAVRVVRGCCAWFAIGLRAFALLRFCVVVFTLLLLCVVDWY